MKKTSISISLILVLALAGIATAADQKDIDALRDKADTLLERIQKMRDAQSPGDLSDGDPTAEEDGDIGVLGIGGGLLGILGILALLSIHHGSMTLWSWILLLGVFLVDATVTLLKRLKAGEIWHRAHNSHAYQHAARKYNSHRTVSVSILLINTLWLFPLSWLALNYPQYGVLLATLGIVPLVLLAIFFGAGQHEAA